METMTHINEPLPAHMQAPSQLGTEISITGKWVPKTKGGIFKKSADSKDMIKEWNDIHQDARVHSGMLSTEINHAVGQDAVLVHHVFESPESLVSYFSNTATEHAEALTRVARPEVHLIRGMKMDDATREALASKGVDGNFGEYLFGYVKHDYQQPDPEHAVQVTAKWTNKEGQSVDELIYWWQRVGTDAFDMEKGLVRFEVYRVVGEDALIIHETFDSSDELKFHLTKGTAAKYKKEIDEVAFPENYFFRGPVSWLIRTYSKFMHLPATYSSRGAHFTADGGNWSDGLTKKA